MKNDLDFVSLTDLDFTAKEKSDLDFVVGAAKVATGIKAEPVGIHPAADGRCVGPIIARNDSWAAQVVDAGKIAMHQASRSNQLPPKGVTACFEYEGGMANCMFPSRELGEKLQGQRILTSPRNGRCSGKVIGADFEYIYQQSHGDTVIAHRLEQLDRAPTLHSSPVIAYSNGKGVCISAEKAKAMEMGKEKGKEMAR